MMASVGFFCIGDSTSSIVSYRMIVDVNCRSLNVFRLCVIKVAVTGHVPCIM